MGSESRDERKALTKGSQVDQRTGVALMQRNFSGKAKRTFHESFMCRYARPLNHYVDASAEMERANPDPRAGRPTIV